MIEQIIKPTISVKEIILAPYNEKNLKQDVKDYWEEMYGVKIADIGKEPLIWYNGVYIPPNQIDSFILSSNKFIPTIEINFKDSTSELINIGFAQDNTIISLYLDSKTKDNGQNSILKPIRMDFKIMDYNYDESNRIFNVTGIVDIDNLYLQKTKSYPNQTSLNVLKEVAKDCGLGFSSNIPDTNDKMKWLNMSLENYEFINDVTDYAYLSDNSFFTSFIDFYYNLNFIDIEKQLKEDIKNQKGVLTSSSEGIDEANSQIVDDLYIVSKNHYNTRLNNVYESYEIMNSSTKISLNNGYKTRIFYYDRTGNWNNNQKAGTFCRFDLETNTDNKGIIMKSNVSDTSETGFFKQNVKNVYVQPLDIDNVHKNYNYAAVLNKLNIEELSKLCIKITMRDANYNFYKYQKIKVFVMNINMGVETILNERLTGNWLITEINFIFDQKNRLRQELIMVKRELSIGEKSYDN